MSTRIRRIYSDIMIQPMATIMDASGTFTAQNWGAKQKRRIRETLRKVLRLEAGYGFFCIAVVYLFGSSMIQITTGTRNPEMVDLAVIGLRIHFSMYPLLGVLLALRVSMQSMGEKTAPIISSAIELVLKFLAAIWLIPAYGFIGTAVTEPVTWVIMTLFLMTVYCIKTKKMLTEEKEKVIKLTTEPVAA